MEKKGTSLTPGPLLWALVLLLLGASYLPLPPFVRTLLGVLSLGWTFLLWRSLPRKGPSLGEGSPGLLLGSALLFLILFCRSFQLTTLPFWPIGDEGILASLAIDQMKAWEWDLLVAEDRQEALGVWVLALFFKLFEPSLLSIRLFPALISLATCALAYWAARQFFPKGTAFLVLGLFGLCFWEFTFSRFCMRVILLVLVQCLCLGLLGLCLRRPGTGWAPWALGLSAGLGFYTFTSWAGVWIGLVLALALCAPASKVRAFLSIFLMGSAAVAAPMAWARLSPGGMSYIGGNFGGGLSPGLFLDYLRQVFWDGMKSFPFGSDWGGLLNPLFGALALLGAAVLFRRPSPRVRWALGLGLLSSMLPALLAQGIELHRITALFPLLTVMAALGVAELSWPLTSHPWGRALALIGASFCLDAYNFIARYCDPTLAPPGQQWRSQEHHQAYGLLKGHAEGEGPLLLFSEFNTDYDEKTLPVAAYPFDGLQDPAKGSRAKTVALLLPPGYAHSLQLEFPGTRVHSIVGTTLGRTRALALILVPLLSIPPDRLKAWREEHALHQKVHLSMREKLRSEDWGRYARSLEGPLPQGDRLLSAVRLEKLAFFAVLDGNFTGAANFYSKAYREGYPSPHLRRNRDRALALSTGTRPSSRPLPEGPAATLRP